MNILLLGSGGREHAIAWKLNQSDLLSKLFIAPGNAGTQSVGTNVNLSLSNFESIKAFCLKNDINIVVVGPEQPLVDGIWDFFENDSQICHITVIGPSQEGAKLEGSKAYAKIFMKENGIPTAGYREFTPESLEAGLKYIETQSPPIVLKADGLAAGKGVVILDNTKDAQDVFTDMLGGKFGAAGNKVVIEDFLDGIEFSVFVLSDGENYKILPIAKDYKRIGERDTGLNTGGMGAISPVPFVDKILMEKVEKRIIIPTIQGLQNRAIVYQGFIFIGLILVDNEPYVIEYNCRMGDPETEVVMPRLKSDLLDLFQGIATQSLDSKSVEIDQRAAATMMLVSGGYPEAYEKGKVIKNLDQVSNSLIFLAGAKELDGRILTNGGRVLTITAYGDTIQDALAICRSGADDISFDGKYFRGDIGYEFG